MKITPFQVYVPLIQVAVVLAVMSVVISIFGFAIASTCYAPVGSTSGRTLSRAFAIGNAMPILGFPGLFMLWAVIHECRKMIAAQKNEIDNLKRELEEMKRKEL